MDSLNNKNLAQLSNSISKPKYDRSKVKPGIVHIGVGGFHRAHQALYLEDLLNIGNHNEWGICGLGLLPSDKTMAEALIPQDCLYSLIEQDAKGNKTKVIGSIIDFIHAPANQDKALNLLCDPIVKIVSLTITEGGYNIDQSNGKFLSNNPEIISEAREPNNPKSVFGYLITALDLRRQKGIKPFTIMSCDNIVHNGDVAAKAFCSFAELRNPELAEWIQCNVAFPNTMVDRITPVTTEQTKNLANQLLQLEDKWPVASESFRQWVIEDKFCNGRPDFEKVGIQLTKDVTPYEVMKIRLLNAGHSAIGYLGYLCGFEYIYQIMQDADFQKLIKLFWDKEVSAFVSEVPGVNLKEYKQSLFDRFSNPNIKDQSLRICSDGSNKLPKFLLPTIQEALANNGDIKLMSLVVASWIRFMNGINEGGQEIPINDPRANIMVPLAKNAQKDIQQIIGVTDVFGNMSKNSTFVNAVSSALNDLYILGARKTVQKYIS